jgi:hypothetical protein
VPLTPITWPRLAEALADRVAALSTADTADGADRLRVGIDGAPAARTGELADAVGEELRVLGRPALRVRTAAFWRPASLRFEFGREDPDAYYERWLDAAALWREVFVPLGPGGTGRALPSLWDPLTDRATRAPYADLPAGGVLLIDGPFLLGHGFPLDLTVHLRLSPAALTRRTPGPEQWTLPAFARYEEEMDPARAVDVLVHTDDPRRPAWTG